MSNSQSNSQSNINETNTIPIAEDFSDSEGDFSDSEESNSYIENMINQLETAQRLYSQFCVQNNKEENFHEMVSLMDIFRGGSGQFICIANEEIFPGETQEQQQEQHQ